MTKHTQTPWGISEGKIIALKMPEIKFPKKGATDGYGNAVETEIYSRQYIVCQPSLYSDPDNETAQANAEFIVRAVNNHEALVEALEYVFASGQPLLTTQAIAKMQSALAKAKGE